jgi:IS30 family transposase
MNYKYLSQNKKDIRSLPLSLMKVGHAKTQIAKFLDRNKSSISRELSRNLGFKGYRPLQAFATAAKRSEKSRNADTMQP